MGNYIIPLEMSMIKQRYYRQYTNKQRIVKVILSFAILIIGGLIYVGFRDKSLLMFTWFEQLGVSGEVDAIRGLVNSGGVYGWVKNSLPDGLWIFAYLFLVDRSLLCYQSSCNILAYSPAYLTGLMSQAIYSQFFCM